MLMFVISICVAVARPGVAWLFKEHGQTFVAIDFYLHSLLGQYFDM